jgi:hypothetical protein
MGLTEFGDPEARVPFVCQLSHLRNDAFSQTDKSFQKHDAIDL